MRALLPIRTDDGTWLLPGTGAAGDFLRQAGLSCGDRVAISAANSPGLATLLHAGWRLGLTLVLVGHRLPADERERLFARSGARLCLSDGQVPDEWPSSDAPAAVPMPDEAPALVLFTSGSTGPPKEVILPRRAVQAAISGAVARLALTSGDLWLNALPCDHIGGAMTVLRQMQAGYGLLLLPRFDVDEAEAIMSQQAVTGVSLVPTMLRRWVERRAGRRWPAQLRVLLTGGGPLDAELDARCTALGLRPCQTYGCTESASMATCPGPAAAAGAEHAGPALDGLAIAIRREDGAAAAVGEEGLIHLRGASLAVPAGTWFAPGDWGLVDAQGNLVVRCRRTDLIVSGGENLSPGLIEEVLRRHPLVRDAVVCPIPDADWGQVPAALLVAESLPEDWEAWCAAHLPPLRRPRRTRCCPELPLLPNGKCDRRACQYMLS